MCTSHRILRTNSLFLTIEEPETPLQFPTALDAAQPPVTIGEFYNELKKQIISLGDSAFVNSPRNQIGPDLLPRAIIVTNVQTAVAAIDLIVEQGEGTSQSPAEGVGNDYAHYYRLNQIAKGKRLIKNTQAPPDQQYIYGACGCPGGGARLVYPVLHEFVI